MKLVSLVLFLAVALLGQDPPAPPRPPRQPPPPPKNLKVLPPENLIRTMQAFRVALGVQCDACHVKGDFASDENPHKDVARRMIVMTQEINSKFPDGKMHVTCYTCHRGAAEPLTAPAAAAEKPAEKPAQ